ncbi:MAG TPA: hypothetical protein VGL07_16920 [Buttiauxella sp.]|jgi:hypothetical protein
MPRRYPSILTLVEESSPPAIELADRTDFLTSWVDGVRTARKGEGIDYSSYCSCPAAFIAGHRHYLGQQHPTAIPYKEEFEGFEGQSCKKTTLIR